MQFSFFATHIFVNLGKLEPRIVAVPSVEDGSDRTSEVNRWPPAHVVVKAHLIYDHLARLCLP